MILRILQTSRTFRVTAPGGKPYDVHQLQTLEWADLTAPDDTKIMRDLVHKARELNTEKKSKKIVKFF